MIKAVGCTTGDHREDVDSREEEMAHAGLVGGKDIGRKTVRTRKERDKCVVI